MRRLLLVIGLAGLCAGCGAKPAKPAFVVAANGTPWADIVLPAKPLDAERYAADELKYHLDKALGAAFEIVNEDRFNPSNFPYHFYVGATRAAAAAKLQGRSLEPDERVLRTSGNGLYLLGRDSGISYRHIGYTWCVRSVGTLYAVYDFLETELGVKWIWPGETGEVIPKFRSLGVAAIDRGGVEPLPERFWHGTASWGDKLGFSSMKALDAFFEAQSKFLVRHRVGRNRNTNVSHSFDKWWERFGKTHPEYFNLLPDGTRRPFHQGSLVTMCCSEPGVWKQRAKDWDEWWRTTGKKNWCEPWVVCCENDSAGLCQCANCRAWDPPDPRFRQCPYWKGGFTRAYMDGLWREPGPNHGDWALSWIVGDNRWDIPEHDSNLKPTAPLGDRYANFYNHIQAEVVRYNPNARVIGYAYENYVEAPQRTKVDPRVIIEFVPRSYFPYDRTESEFFRKHWVGWRKAGVKDLTYRPNYMLAGGNYLFDQGKLILDDFAFAYTNGMFGCAFDSLRGSWSAHALMDYALVRAFRDPLHGYARAREEMLSAFGSARPAVAKYLDAVYGHTTGFSFAEVRKISWANHTGAQGGGSHGNGSAIVGEFFDEGFLAMCHRLLDEAVRQANGDREVLARIGFLRAGVRDTELTRKTRLAQKARDLDKGDPVKEKAFEEAFKAMNDYRASVEGLCVCNFKLEATNERNSMGWPHKPIEKAGK